MDKVKSNRSCTWLFNIIISLSLFPSIFKLSWLLLSIIKLTIRFFPFTHEKLKILLLIFNDGVI
jgi:hypothetical protein